MKTRIFPSDEGLKSNLCDSDIWNQEILHFKTSLCNFQNLFETNHSSVSVYLNNDVMKQIFSFKIKLKGSVCIAQLLCFMFIELFKTWQSSRLPFPQFNGSETCRILVLYWENGLDFYASFQNFPIFILLYNLS